MDNLLIWLVVYLPPWIYESHLHSQYVEKMFQTTNQRCFNGKAFLKILQETYVTWPPWPQGLLLESARIFGSSTFGTYPARSSWKDNDRLHRCWNLKLPWLNCGKPRLFCSPASVLQASKLCQRMSTSFSFSITLMAMGHVQYQHIWLKWNLTHLMWNMEYHLLYLHESIHPSSLQSEDETWAASTLLSRVG